MVMLYVGSLISDRRKISPSTLNDLSELTNFSFPRDRRKTYNFAMISGEI